jgi:hypothetical protein
VARIKVNGQTAPKKAARVSAGPRFLDEKYVGTEPVWPTEQAQNWDQDKFDHHLRRSLNYYNYFYSSRDLKKFVVSWLKSSGLLTPPQLSAYVASSDSVTSMTVCGVVKSWLQGMPVLDQHRQYVIDHVLGIVSREQPVEPKPAAEVVARVTVADRVAEKVAEHNGEIQGLIDQAIADRSDLALYDWLKANNVPQAGIGRIQQVLERQLNEYDQLVNKPDEQLREAYAHWNRAKVKWVIALYQRMMGDLDNYRQVKRITRQARVKKAPSKEKLVARLRYLKQDAALKLVSVNPVDILGQQVLWVYNVKTRKLTRYQADQHQGPLSVKGTAIVGYDASQSVSKTLRRPAEQLASFAKAGKVQLRKFMDEIRAVATQANGRINVDCVLLKTY